MAETEKIENELIRNTLDSYARHVSSMSVALCTYKEQLKNFSSFDDLNPDADVDDKIETSEEFNVLMYAFNSAYTSLDVLNSLLARYQRHFENTEEK